MAALVSPTAPLITTAAGCRFCGRGLADGNHRNDPRPLGPSAAAIGRCSRSVEGSVSSALSSARERVGNSDADRQGGLCRHAQGSRVLKLAGGGKEQPLTCCRRAKKMSGCSCSCSQRLQDGACGCTLRSMQRERVGLTSKATRLSICDRDGWY